jgi:hypothetical protein
MPYVDMKTRERLDGDSRGIGANRPQNAGQLTYDLQQCLKRYLEDRGLSYQTIAECLGALEGAKCDLIERVVKPYEARKLAENGDVWPLTLTSSTWMRPEAVEKAKLPTWLCGRCGRPGNTSDRCPFCGAHHTERGPYTPPPTGSVHTCSAECACQTGGTPTPDFFGGAAF